MSEFYVPVRRVIPATEWSSPERREAFEANNGGVGTGQYWYNFDGCPLSAMRSIDDLAAGRVARLSKNLGGPEANHRALSDYKYENADGTFSGGYIVFTAANRKIIEKDQPFIVDELNIALAGLCSPYRLAPTPEPQYQ